MTKPTRAVSSPGKVLFAGGYLVLDRKHNALVFGLDARIHVHVKALPTSEGVSLQEIIVRSPQFTGATWRYGYNTASQNGGIVATQLMSNSNGTHQPNPFVETALSYALTYVSTLIEPVVIEPALITILADNDYYSPPAVASQPSRDDDGHSRFKNFNVPLQEAHKTGLGSSAALVTAFVAAVIVHNLPQAEFSLNEDKGRRILHNLAQAAHSAAQGKIGSGFDIASAVFGSCVYRRFSPSFLGSMGDIGSPQFAQKLKTVVEEHPPSRPWDMEISHNKVTIPKHLRLVMCDVDCGSKTPGMVKKVLQWRENNPDDADELWDAIQQRNDEIAEQLVALQKEGVGDYGPLASVIERQRKLVRTMSERSGVLIEPWAQTELLDAATDLDGVVGGVTPGAGGYDACALLIEDKPEVSERLKDFLSSWTFKVDEPGAQTQTTGKVRLLSVREEMEGVRAEAPQIYDTWAS